MSLFPIYCSAADNQNPMEFSIGVERMPGEYLYELIVDYPTWEDKYYEIHHRDFAYQVIEISLPVETWMARIDLGVSLASNRIKLNGFLKKNLSDPGDRINYSVNNYWFLQAIGAASSNNYTSHMGWDISAYDVWGYGFRGQWVFWETTSWVFFTGLGGQRLDNQYEGVLVSKTESSDGDHIEQNIPNGRRTDFDLTMDQVYLVFGCSLKFGKKTTLTARFLGPGYGRADFANDIPKNTFGDLYNQNEVTGSYTRAELAFEHYFGDTHFIRAGIGYTNITLHGDDYKYNVYTFYSKMAYQEATAMATFGWEF